MIELFKRCLEAEYTHLSDGGDYAVQVDGDTLYLLFEWSDGAEDWKSNFDFPVVAYKNGEVEWKCHRGFLARWKAMRDDIEKIASGILMTDPAVRNITCIGYSHGAAIAVLATEDMEYLYGKYFNVKGYGFGAPRVLWGTLPQEVTKRLKNFTTIRNVPDLVTHVPPALFGYHNAGTLKKVGSLGKYGPIKAHTPEAYLAELE